MNRFLPLGIALVAIAGAIVYDASRPPAVNPDPNHTHADFAVWVGGMKLDFSDESYMSVEYHPGEPAVRPASPLRKYLHLHDGIGHVIHRHKPGMTLGDFFDSLDMPMTDACLTVNPQRSYCIEDGKRWRMFVNGKEMPFDPDYVFQDVDQILLTWGSDDAAIAEQLKMLADDACLYSQTCPERGEPPEEGCVADPEVPCVEP